MDARPPAGLSGPRRFALEFLWFGLKEARACLFAGLFFACLFLVPREGVLGVPRYDVLLVLALGIQAWMLLAGLESRDELKAICLFHVVGFVLTGFFIWLAENVSTLLGAWQYPNQLGAWATVHLGKWSSWSLLVVMTFTIVAGLKHIKQSIDVPVSVLPAARKQA